MKSVAIVQAIAVVVSTLDHIHTFNSQRIVVMAILSLDPSLDSFMLYFSIAFT